MNSLCEIITNLAISVLGSAITMYIAYIWKFRRLIQKSHFRNQEDAEKMILSDIKRSKTLRVYAMCGSTFSNVNESEIAKQVYVDKNLKQQYLVSEEENVNIQKRQEELPKGANDLKEKVRKSLNDFKSAMQVNNNITIRLHRKKVGFRLILLDDCLYLSQQENGKYGKDTEMQRIPFGTPAYINFSDFFDENWNDANCL